MRVWLTLAHSAELMEIVRQQMSDTFPETFTVEHEHLDNPPARYYHWSLYASGVADGDWKRKHELQDRARELIKAGSK